MVSSKELCFSANEDTLHGNHIVPCPPFAPLTSDKFIPNFMKEVPYIHMENASISRTCHNNFQVSCHAGYKGEERPLSFEFAGKKIHIRKVLRQWRDEAHDYFKILSSERDKFLLSYSRQNHIWEIRILNRDSIQIPRRQISG